MSESPNPCRLIESVMLLFKLIILKLILLYIKDFIIDKISWIPTISQYFNSLKQSVMSLHSKEFIRFNNLLCATLTFSIKSPPLNKIVLLSFKNFISMLSLTSRSSFKKGNFLKDLIRNQ